MPSPPRTRMKTALPYSPAPSAVANLCQDGVLYGWATGATSFYGLTNGLPQRGIDGDDTTTQAPTAVRNIVWAQNTGFAFQGIVDEAAGAGFDWRDRLVEGYLYWHPNRDITPGGGYDNIQAATEGPVRFYTGAGITVPGYPSVGGNLSIWATGGPMSRLGYMVDAATGDLWVQGQYGYAWGYLRASNRFYQRGVRG